MSALTIRHAAPDDAADFARLNRGFNEIDNSPDEIRKRLEDPPANELVFVAVEGGALVGFACAQMIRSVCYAHPWAELTELYVPLDHRRRGIAGQLIRTAEEAAVERGADEITLRVGRDNDVARQLYESAGYEDEGHDCLTKRLDA